MYPRSRGFAANTASSASRTVAPGTSAGGAATRRWRFPVKVTRGIRLTLTPPCPTRGQGGRGDGGWGAPKAREPDFFSYLFRRKRLRHVLAHQLRQRIPVDEIDRVSLRRVARVGGESAQRHQNAFSHELRASRLDEVAHLVGVGGYPWCAEKAVHIEPAAADGGRVIGVEVYGCGSPLAALGMEAHLGEQRQEQPLEALDAIRPHPRQLAVSLARQVFGRGGRHRLPLADEQDEQESDAGCRRCDEEDSHDAHREMVDLSGIEPETSRVRF